MQKNIDYLAYEPQWVTSWKFTIVGKVKNLSGVIDEISGITEKVLSICNGFFMPTDIEYTLLTYSDNLPANYFICAPYSNVKSVEFVERKIQSNAGISINKFHDDIHGLNAFTHNTYGDIRRISIDGKTKFLLKEIDEYIDINSKEVYGLSEDECLTDQEAIASQPGSNPLYIAITRSMLRDESQEVTCADPAYYWIRFATYTDMWFEGTEIGRANRNRLRHVLKSVYDNFEVVHTLFMSDYFTQDDLRNIVFGND